MPEDRSSFQEEYRDWVLSMARQVSFSLASMPAARREKAVNEHKRLRDPGAVFHGLSDPDRVERLAGDKLKGFIMVETEAVTFFPSIYSSIPGALDFAVALNRRYFFRDLWFPIISLNSEYISKSSDRLLTFAIEHELEMSRIYQDLSLNLRSLSVDEKRDAASFAQAASADRLKITVEELREDEKLMLDLSRSRVLIPKSYAETALLQYLEDNFSKVERCGTVSRSAEEAAFGAELLSEFESWSGFSIETYSLFVREILADLNDTYMGYC